jgi:salicylate hydroxylase
MSKHQRIAIAGAGIAGLTTALALLQQGFKVDVFG